VRVASHAVAHAGAHRQAIPAVAGTSFAHPAIPVRITIVDRLERAQWFLRLSAIVLNCD
jgi:hypothetical protein